MRPIIVILLLAALPDQIDRAGSAKAIFAEVVVYGGTSAGVIAAVQVARMGKSVALIEPGQHIGGMSVEGLGGSDIDNHQEFQNSPAVGGLALEFYRRVSRRYGRSERFEKMVAARAKEPSLWRFEPSVAEAVFNEMVREHSVRVFLNHRLSEVKGVEKDAKTRRVVAIRCENGVEFRSSVFIDATYEGDLLAGAGISTVIGREANSKYGETKNGIRGENTYRQFEVRVDPYRIPGDPRSGLIPTIQDEPLGAPGEGDHRIQAYCFRMCLTKIPDNRIPFSKPDNFDTEQYEIYRRYAKAGGKLWRPGASLPNGKTDQGSWHDLSANLYGMNHAYPGGSYATRERIYREHLTFTQGLCWFLANDPELPEDVRREWAQWGVCKDEFQDNGGWPRRFYVRDARRMVSDYVITEHHTRKTNQVAVADPVAVAFWPPDTHHVRRIVRDGAAYNEGFVFGGDDWSPFGVSYRALVPRASECANLLTPTCLSSSHVGYGAIRLEWTFMALGQSAATAACLAIDDNVPVQQVKYAKLRARLLADKAVSSLQTQAQPTIRNKPEPDSVDAYLRSQMEKRRIPGLQLAVVRHGKIVKLGAYGLANVQDSIPVTNQTRFTINSITKSFTGVAIMQLVEGGKPDLDAPVSRYLDGLPAAWQAVSIRRLLTHTSGLPNGDNEKDGYDAFWSKLQTLPMEFAPGEQFRYNSTNYLLLGRIIDKLSGQPFTQFITERQLRVAGCR